MSMHPSHPDAPRGDLITDLLQGLSRLVRGEIELAKAEAERSARAALRGVILAAVAAAAGLAAIGLLAAALALGLMAWGLSAPVAVLASAGVCLALCAGFAMAAAHLLKRAGNFPRRPARNLSRDIQTLREGVTSDAQY